MKKNKLFDTFKKKHSLRSRENGKYLSICTLFFLSCMHESEYFLPHLPHQTFKRDGKSIQKSSLAITTGDCIDLNHFDDYYLLLFNKILAHVRGICISDSLSRVEQSKYKHYSRGEKVEFNKYRVFCLCL